MHKNTVEQICPKCVMDTTAKDFVIIDGNRCNYCDGLMKKLENDEVLTNINREAQAKEFFNKIKQDGNNKKYDCIIGLSGGVDSSWVLYLAVKMGLRPLAVHMDNGWNSELSQQNIENLVRKLKVDLYTHVIDWNEYKALQHAFFDADVIDIELLYDNALYKINHQLASTYNIKYLLSGSNTSTEGMQMPLNWAYRNKLDKRNIYSIWRKKGSGIPLKTFPTFGFLDFIKYRYFKKIKWVRFLDYFDYNKNEAIETLVREVGYRPYLYKHYESVFTRFYQGYILPVKFNVDKRKVHLSTLIITGQMSRDEALETLKKQPYFSESELENDKEYFLKKFGWSSADLQNYLDRPEIDHEVYGSENFIWDFIIKLKQLILSVK